MNTYLDYNELIESRKRLRAAFFDPSIVRQSKHRLRGGDQATFYFDFDIMTNDPQRCSDVVRNFSAKLLEISLRRRIDFIAFIEKMGRATVGAIRVAGAISIDVAIPSFVIREGKELSFEKIKIPARKGTAASQKLVGINVALITDHTTSGSEILMTVNMIEAVGGHVSDVIMYTLKPSYARAALLELLDRKIVVHSIYYMYDFADGTFQETGGGTIETKEQVPTIET